MEKKFGLSIIFIALYFLSLSAIAKETDANNRSKSISSKLSKLIYEYKKGKEVNDLYRSLINDEKWDKKIEKISLWNLSKGKNSHIFNSAFDITIYSDYSDNQKLKNRKINIVFVCDASKNMEGMFSLSGHFEDIPEGKERLIMSRILQTMKELNTEPRITLYNLKGSRIHSQVIKFDLDEDSSSIISNIDLTKIHKQTQNQFNEEELYVKIELPDPFVIESTSSIDEVQLSGHAIMFRLTISKTGKLSLVANPAFLVIMSLISLFFRYRRRVFPKEKLNFKQKILPKTAISQEEVAHVKKRVACGYLQEALEIAQETFSNTKISNELICLQSRYSQILERKRYGVIDDRSYSVELNQVTRSILQTISLIET